MTKSVLSELRHIARSNGGLLKPETVVEAARPKTSPLHGRFTWDDTEAARRFRLEEARQLIQVTVSYLKVDGKDRSFRVFCSLTPDRHNKSGGGYREITAVLKNRSMREQLIADALAELELFEKKYKSLTELAGVLGEIRKVLETEEKEETAVA